MAARTANPLLVTAVAALGSFGFLTVVLVGLGLGAAVAGPVGGILGALGLSTGWLLLVLRVWRRLHRPPGEPTPG